MPVEPGTGRVFNDQGVQKQPPSLFGHHSQQPGVPVYQQPGPGGVVQPGVPQQPAQGGVGPQAQQPVTLGGVWQGFRNRMGNWFNETPPNAPAQQPQPGPGGVVQPGVPQPQQIQGGAMVQGPPQAQQPQNPPISMGDPNMAVRNPYLLDMLPPFQPPPSLAPPVEEPAPVQQQGGMFAGLRQRLHFGQHRQQPQAEYQPIPEVQQVQQPQPAAGNPPYGQQVAQPFTPVFGTQQQAQQPTGIEPMEELHQRPVSQVIPEQGVTRAVPQQLPEQHAQHTFYGQQTQQPQQTTQTQKPKVARTYVASKLNPALQGTPEGELVVIRYYAGWDPSQRANVEATFTAYSLAGFDMEGESDDFIVRGQIGPGGKVTPFRSYDEANAEHKRRFVRST